MDGGQEVSGKFVVASSNTPEILEPAETALDNIAPFIEALAEAVEGYPVGFVWNDGFRAAIDDFRAKAVAIVAFVPNEGRHGRRELQKGRPCGNVCGLSRSEMKCARFAIRLAQRADFRGPARRASGRSPVHAPPFSAARRAMRFDRGGVDRQSHSVLAAAGERFKDRLPMSALSPAIEPIVDRRVRTMVVRVRGLF